MQWREFFEKTAPARLEQTVWVQIGDYQLPVSHLEFQGNDFIIVVEENKTE